MSEIRLGIVTPVADEASTIEELIRKDLANIGPEDHFFRGCTRQGKGLCLRNGSISLSIKQKDSAGTA